MIETILTLVWFGIIAFGVIMYVLMDGFVLGIGILSRWAGNEDNRDIMMNSVAPIWDGNETWLVLGGASLLAAFPIAYSVILSALYLPLLFMLIALIFRGVAFEFRFKAETSKYLWNAAFFGGSVLATFAQGVVLGALVQGIEVADRQYAGGTFDWLNPFSLVVGIALLSGYALLGSTWLIIKTEGELQDWAYRISVRLTMAVVGFIALISIWVPFLDPEIAGRWFSWPNIAFLSPVPLLVALLAYGLYRAEQRRRTYHPFILSIGLFLLSYLGLAISIWPNIIPPDVSIWEAASPPESQLFLLVGMLFLIPVILVYTAWSYWVFRGKVTGETGYH